MIGTVERRCRLGAALHTTFVNLNHSPLANSLLHRDALDEMESFYPLHAFVCDQCFLVQLDLFEPPERIFGRYLYFLLRRYLAKARKALLRSDAQAF